MWWCLRFHALPQCSITMSESNRQRNCLSTSYTSKNEWWWTNRIVNFSHVLLFFYIKMCKNIFILTLKRKNKLRKCFKYLYKFI
jgi:hypothetical protein